VEKVIKSFQLYQNYPNPFNPSTTIEYEIPKTGLVEINIYNVQGRLVKKLDNSLHQSGTQKIVWNGRDNFGNTTASGIYFCQVKFAGDILVKKIVLIK
jgi:flagellar hook assembly protein FlgD